MPIQMKKSGDGSFELTIEDRFDPNEDYTVEVMDMDTYSGVSKIDGKAFTSLKWIYRVFDADGVAFIDQVSGDAWEGVEFSSMSLFGTAKGRGWASAFIGHELSDEECDEIADNFDGAMIGKRARVSFKLVEKKSESGTVLGHNLTWAFVRPLVRQPAARAARPARPAPTPIVPPTSAANGPGPMPTGGPGAAPVAYQGRETPAQKRARLEAELAAMQDDDQVAEDTGGDDDLPF